MIDLPGGQRAHPRSRGENGGIGRLVLGHGGSSPLTRGKQPGPPRSLPRSRLIPAHAGKTGSMRGCPRSCEAHPRSRGENRVRGHRPQDRRGSSPLTRGKHQTDRVSVHSRGLIPAHAGKTPTACSALAATGAHPRSRGENRLRGRFMWRTLGSSPLTRGKPPALMAGAAPPWAHPRSRGENHHDCDCEIVPAGSSPLTRGKRLLRSRISPRPGLIPAHAGKTRGTGESRPGAGAHPRSRGENAVVL